MSLETPLLPKKKTCQLIEHLEDPDFREVWIAFLKKTYCYENMMFYEAVENYQSSTSVERVRLARLIYCNFIDEGAENQVNLSNEERRPLANTILLLAQASDEHAQAELAKKDLFDKAQKSILLLMQTDSLTAFFKNPLYKRHLKEKEAEGKQRLLQEEKEMSEWMRSITQRDEPECDCSNLFVWCCCCCYWCCMPSYEP